MKNTTKLILCCIFIIGTVYHASFLHLNEIMKISDSFAYLQMADFLSIFSQQGFGNGWFGFIYSLPIAILNIFFSDNFLSAKIVNLILFNISAFLLWRISKTIFDKNIFFPYLVVILFFLSPTLLHFNIHVLSENIYIPLFLGLFLALQNFITQANIKNTLIISILLGIMYLTRAEAFIYIGSVGIISLGLLIQRKISFKKFMGLGSIFFIIFFLFISPYLFHLQSLTGQWGLTNKGASNLRQAELRGQEKMDDAGFEKSVAELTSDKQHLIAGFAGGMKYDAPQIDMTLRDFVLKDPLSFIQRIAGNQKKLFIQNFPEIFLGKSPQLYFSNDTRFSHILFLLWILIPIGILLFGIYKIFQKEKGFFNISIAFFVPAFFFFTLFFTLNRYFLIFLPLLLISFTYGIKELSLLKLNTFLLNKKIILALQIFGIFNIISIFLLSTLVYYNIESPKDEYYSLKKEAGEWLQENFQGDIKLMERFPIVTYYAGAKFRYITPYTNNITDIIEYALYTNIDILVVDSMDFQTYRPKLIKYLKYTPKGFIKLQEFQNPQGQKVILYQLKK